MYPKLLIADSRNRIFDVDGVAAMGMKAGGFYTLEPEELIPLPFASELFVLKDAVVPGFDCVDGRKCFPVAGFLSPGYTATFNTAYQPKTNKILPLFSYAAVCWYKNKFYAAAVKVENERRQDLRLMDMALMRKNAANVQKKYPRNRLIRHLAGCSGTYGCPAAINFFLKRYECPLPASPTCNSSCVGCISVKHSPSCPEVQPRIKFTPTPEEIAQVALMHFSAVRQPVASFGQGCEGEPLMVADVLEKAIKLIRRETSKGVINLNTNASKPKAIEKLRQAGLDSIRVSVNSVREKYYNAYYNPRGYSFSDVISSIKLMKRSGGFVSINYLVMPGFTDHKDEVRALYDFIKSTKIDMIQWRNLNYDPYDYFRKMGIDVGGGRDRPLHIGVRQLIEETKRRFPKLRHGYFNPRVIARSLAPQLRGETTKPAASPLGEQTPRNSEKSISVNTRRLLRPRKFGASQRREG